MNRKWILSTRITIMKRSLIMKKMVLIAIVWFPLLSVLGVYSFSNEKEGIENDKICVIINIESYSITERNKESLININNFGFLNSPGVPKLPSKIVSIAIPPGAVCMNVSYDISKRIAIPGNYFISPVKKSVSWDGSTSTVSENDEQKYEENFNLIYTSDAIYPSEPVEYVRTSYYREYNLVDVQVTPFAYKPLSGIIEFHPEIVINVEYDQDKKNVEYIGKSLRILDTAKDIVVNYEESKQWYHPCMSGNNEKFDFVVITLDSLTSAITPLVNWEIEKGRSVNVTTISRIETNYNGYDLAEKIRNFLRDKYLSKDWGIEDVLLVGHWNDIPTRLTWEREGDQKFPSTDYYYAELSKPDNESWDADNDHQYGERSDPVDFFAEVNVGRIPWSDPDMVKHICDKSVAFEQNTDIQYKNNILLLGAVIEDEDGAAYCEKIIDSSLNPWMANWERTRLYEIKSSYFKDYILNHQNVLNIWSLGKFAVVTWNSHASYFGAYTSDWELFIEINDCQYLNDEYPSIVSAMSCSASDTDYLNIGQAMMKQGAVGFLGANKGSFGKLNWTNPYDGGGQSFHYFFNSCITSRNFTQGQAHQYALREMYQKNLWTENPRYETFIWGSLWGNPDLGIYPVYPNSPPNKPMTPEGPISGRTDRIYSFTTKSADVNSDDLYYCWDWGDGNTQWFGPFDSGEECSVSYGWNKQGIYKIQVKVKDLRGAESEWSDPLSVFMRRVKKSRVIR